MAPTAWADSAPKGQTALSQSEKAGRSSAYSTALAQLSLSHSKLRETTEGKADVYREVQLAAKKVFTALSLSGVVSSAAPEGDELELEWVHGEWGCVGTGVLDGHIWCSFYLHHFSSHFLPFIITTLCPFIVYF